MAKGSGLSIDYSSSSDRIRFCFDHNHLQNSPPPALIINSFPYQLHHRFKFESEQLPDMDSDSNTRELSTIQFPVNLTIAALRHNDKGDEDSAPAPSDHQTRRVIGEMDFFANSNNNNEEDDRQNSAAATSADDKDRVVNVNTGLHLLTANTGSDQSTIDDGISPHMEDKRSAKSVELGALRAEVERINRENQQLRSMLSQVNNNYNALHMHLIALMHHQQQKNHDDCKPDRDNEEDNNNKDDENSKSKHGISRREETEPTGPRQFMDLGFADSCNEPSSLSKSSRVRTLGHRSRSPPEDNHEVDDNGRGWAPNKVPKFTESSSKTNGSGGVDQAAEATMRKARVSVRARSEAPLIRDGCQWRKYGQKMAKGNPCPRAYYRCTMASGCPVRKQVQRCAEDRTILITTYEGTHNHPLPPAAMMMASATSSAARMLLSGSMPSPDGTGLINTPNFLTYNRSLFPCSSSSVATISASAPFPTVTLDLTQSPNTVTDDNPLQQLFQRPPQPNHFPVPFSGPPTLPAPLFGQPLYNQSRFSGLQVSGQDGAPNNNSNNPLADTVATLTTDPNFTVALAAAITSLIGNGGANNSNNHNHVLAVTSDSNGNNTNSHDNNNSNGN